MTEMSLIDGVLLVMIIASVVSFIKFLIGGYLLYNVVLVSAIQHESAVSLHISSPHRWNFKSFSVSMMHTINLYFKKIKTLKVSM